MATQSHRRAQGANRQEDGGADVAAHRCGSARACSGAAESRRAAPVAASCCRRPHCGAPPLPLPGPPPHPDFGSGALLLQDALACRLDAFGATLCERAETEEQLLVGVLCGSVE